MATGSDRCEDYREAVEPSEAEHYAAERQLKDKAADRALMAQFSVDPVLLDEQFAGERQIEEEDSDFDFTSDEDEDTANAPATNDPAPPPPAPPPPSL